LLAVTEAARRHADIHWLFLVDSDTLVFPWRLAHGLLDTLVAVVPKKSFALLCFVKRTNLPNQQVRLFSSPL
jgi:hypothetical protein